MNLLCNKEKKRATLLTKMSKRKALYIMLAPTLIYFIIFKYTPMFGNIMAFQDYSIVKGVLGSKFVGLKNFREFLSSYKFFELLINTLRLNILRLVIGFPLPIIFALLLEECKCLRFKKTVQTVTYMPYFISTVVIVSMVMTFVSSDGVINGIRGIFGMEKVSFMTEPEYFPLIYVISDIWHSLGWNSIIYIAAIASVEQELYEAIRVDGAGRFGQVWHITLPGIASTIAIMLILQVGQMLSVGYEKIILMYNPTIYKTADVISTYVYRRGLLEADYSYSTAVSMFNAICNMILLFVANQASKKLTGNGLW